MIAIGIDPGWTAGAVAFVADGNRILTGITYRWRKGTRKRRDGYEVAYAHLGKARTLGYPAHHLAEVGQLVLDLACELRAVEQSRWILAIEETFGRGGVLRKLAESAGLLAGPAMTVAENYGELRSGAWHVNPQTWRPAILGVRGNTKGTDEVARRLVPAMFGGWGALGALGESTHLMEAACIARWAAITWEQREAA